MKAEIFEFLIKVITLFFGVFLLILAVSLHLAERGITQPINDITGATQAFAYDSEEARDKSIEKIEQLDIHTGDVLAMASYPYFDLNKMPYYEYAVARAKQWQASLSGAPEYNSAKYAGIYKLTEKIAGVE